MWAELERRASGREIPFTEYVCSQLDFTGSTYFTEKKTEKNWILLHCRVIYVHSLKHECNSSTAEGHRYSSSSDEFRHHTVPYRVKEVLSDRRYRLDDLENQMISDVFDVSQLRVEPSWP